MTPHSGVIMVISVYQPNKACMAGTITKGERTIPTNTRMATTSIRAEKKVMGGSKVYFRDDGLRVRDAAIAIANKTNRFTRVLLGLESLVWKGAAA